MAQHPSTPMTEADLRRVLAEQFARRSVPAAVHLPAYSDGTFTELWGQLPSTSPWRAFVVDAVDDAHMDRSPAP